MSDIKNPTILITEEPDLVLRNWFKKQAIQVSVDSFIKCKLLRLTEALAHEIQESNADAVVITSYNAARWLRKNYQKLQLNQGILYCSTSKIASLLNPYFKDVRVSSHISAEFTANKVLEDRSIKKVLFLAATQPLNMVAEIVQGGGVVCQLVSVYQTLLLPHKSKLEKPDAVLFFNDEQVLSFAQGQNFVSQDTKVYALGNTTARLVVDKLHVNPIVVSAKDIASFVKRGITDLTHGSNFKKSNDEELVFY